MTTPYLVIGVVVMVLGALVHNGVNLHAICDGQGARGARGERILEGYRDLCHRGLVWLLIRIRPIRGEALPPSDQA
ncbi:MAG: hypothetical protein F6K00_09305 [Leptolyngbya sp. SIOISBB]|nr:hypothetical protein [Leptolyngbya sp. SIOISBB]